jgi:hypothetical protein
MSHGIPQGDAPLIRDWHWHLALVGGEIPDICCLDCECGVMQKCCIAHIIIFLPVFPIVNAALHHLHQFRG